MNCVVVGQKDNLGEDKVDATSSGGMDVGDNKGVGNVHRAVVEEGFNGSDDDDLKVAPPSAVRERSCSSFNAFFK